MHQRRWECCRRDKSLCLRRSRTEIRILAVVYTGASAEKLAVYIEVSDELLAVYIEAPDVELLAACIESPDAELAAYTEDAKLAALYVGCIEAVCIVAARIAMQALRAANPKAAHTHTRKLVPAVSSSMVWHYDWTPVGTLVLMATVVENLLQLPAENNCTAMHSHRCHPHNPFFHRTSFHPECTRHTRIGMRISCTAKLHNISQSHRNCPRNPKRRRT